MARCGRRSRWVWLLMAVVAAVALSLSTAACGTDETTPAADGASNAGNDTDTAAETTGDDTDTAAETTGDDTDTAAETTGDDTDTAAETASDDTDTGETADADVTAEAVDTGTVDDEEELFPDVVGVELEPDGSGTFTVNVTLSSPYDTPQRYADAWRVSGPDGTVFGTRELAHDHAAEQPFTRSLREVAIPDGVTDVVVEGRDQVSGWGGATMTVPVPGR